MALSPMTQALVRLGVDPDRSPLTGWTRAHHLLVADRSLLALRPWASPGHGRFALPGPASVSGPASDGLEAFARSFLTAGFRLAGGTEDRYDHAGFYASGLAAGSDPAAVERWPRMTETRQARVEAAALVIGLHESRRWIWDGLDSSVRERLVDWLAESVGASHGAYGDNNWRWFQNITQAFLRSVGGPYDQSEIDTNLAFLDDCYLGDGWYTDGRPGGRAGNIDWYNAWVMHLFSLWYCRILGDAAPAGLLEHYQDRLAAFLPVGARLFGHDGAPLFQGRSLVYRFATTAALWAGPVFEVDTLAAGTVRGVGSAALRYFVEHGAYDEQDLLTLGWHGRFEPMRQPYSGPGSPYWAGLGFAGLVLPATHPVWTDVEQEVPGADVEAVRPLGWLVGRADGLVRVVNHRVDHSGPEPAAEDPQYCRYGYSSATAPVPRPAGETGDSAVVDNQVTLRDARGRWSHRRPIAATAITGHTATSRHTAHFPTADGEFEAGPEIASGSVLRGAVEVRAVRVGPGGPPARLVVSGFARPLQAADSPGLLSTVHPLLGNLDLGRSEHPVANPFGSPLEVPWAETAADVVPGETYVVAVVVATGDTQPPALPEVRVHDDGVEVVWPDGDRDVLELDAPVLDQAVTR